MVVFEVADVPQFLFKFNVQEIQQRLPDDVDGKAVLEASFVEIFTEKFN